MNGTTFSVTRAIDLMPPMITRPTARAKTMPMTQVRRRVALVVGHREDLGGGLVGLEHVAAAERAEDAEDGEGGREDLAEAGEPEWPDRRAGSTSGRRRRCRPRARLRYFTPRVHSASLVLMPRNPARIIQKVAPGPPRVIATATPAMLPSPTVPETGGRQRLEVRHLTGVLGLGVAPAHQVDRVGETADVEEAEVEGEEDRGHDQPHDDRQDVDAADGDRIEDDLGDLVEDPVEEGLVPSRSHHGTTVTGIGALVHQVPGDGPEQRAPDAAVTGPPDDDRRRVEVTGELDERVDRVAVTHHRGHLARGGGRGLDRRLDDLGGGRLDLCLLLPARDSFSVGVLKE